jgi:lysylphosphatidylglycerol synthetase-like protein (DUF2156 family)
MRDLLSSLSLASGAVVVASICVALAFVCAGFTTSWRWILATAISFLLATLLYWSPVVLGSSAGEYFAWAPLVIGVWWLSGVASFVVANFFVQRGRHA